MREVLLRWTGAGVLALALVTAGCAKKEEGMSAQPAGTAAPAPAGVPAEQAPMAGQAPAAGQPAPRPTVSGPGVSAPSASGQTAGSLAASSRIEQVAEAPKPVQPPPPPPPRQLTLAAGTSISVRTITTISTKTAIAGDRFEGTLAKDLEVDGYVIAPRGAKVVGEVTDSDAGGRVKGVASLTVRLNRITDHTGDAVPVSTQAVSKAAQSSTKKDALKVGIGAGIGAAIGAIAGGGKGAAIGAGAGGAAGTGMVLATRGDAATIPSETVLTFRLSAPVTVTEKK